MKNRVWAALTLSTLVTVAGCVEDAAVEDAGGGGFDAAPFDGGPGPDGGHPIECEGVATACTGLEATDCMHVLGCSMSSCGGTAVACGEYRMQGECDATAGCRWSGTSCGGTATACAVIDGDTACAAQQGCIWNATPACQGRSTACRDIARADCHLQPGCVTIETDGGPPRDGGADAFVAPTDAGVVERDGGFCTPPEGPAPFTGCNPTSGVECDGDWAGRCRTTCTADQCCSPQLNSFECVPRNTDGTCPAADLFVDETRMNFSIDYTYFAEGACELVERCVGGPGLRRLLRFDTWTPNIGGADMFLGVPAGDVDYFEYSTCHMHYHFNSYAEYELLSSDEVCVEATGHKQAFCLLDFYDYPCDPTGADPTVPDCRRTSGGYTCGNQGIRRNSQDVYYNGLDCQWIDITDVDPGDYVLRVRINTEHILNEENYGNNEIRVPFTVPAPAEVDVTTACARASEEPGRDCGWRLEGTHTCTPGTAVTAGCSAGCSLGSCTGDPVMRVCESSFGNLCTAAHTIALNDDSGCAARDTCSQVDFTCPDSGSYNVFTAPLNSGRTATCTVATTP